MKRSLVIERKLAEYEEKRRAAVARERKKDKDQQKKEQLEMLAALTEAISRADVDAIGVRSYLLRIVEERRKAKNLKDRGTEG